MMHDESDVWNDGLSVLFTSFWGWDPKTWGTVGWTGKRGLTRRSNLLKKLSNPFIVVCYVTSNKSYIDPDLKGMLAGFYLVSHETGDRDDFTHPIHHGRDISKWRHSLRALRAFSYLPEYRISVADLDPTMLARARSISGMAEILTDSAIVNRLREIPYSEVDVYKSPTSTSDTIENTARQGLVKAGPASAEGYVVAGGSQLTQRELYVLRLDGDIDAYLGRPANGRYIIKVGLSASPDMRRQAFQKAMPRGAFEWKIERTTRGEGMVIYSSYAIAVRGEYAMKQHLAQHAEWLGGEFYLASQEVIKSAWALGCAASKHAEVWLQ
jgi:hypothetical protein